MISIVIRTLNEKERLEELLRALKKQKCSLPFEIIVVDNESTDGSKELAEGFGTKVITLPRQEFTYPKSMNLGVEHSSGEYIVLTVGHALPISDYWLENIVLDFKNENIAGMYGPCLPRKGALFFEKYLYYFWYAIQAIGGKKTLTRNRTAIMGATNCVIRKSLWLKNKFDERFEMGGEDSQWANWALNQGYKIILDPNFVVRHSHPIKNFSDYRQQMAYWGKLSKPTKFDHKELEFRTDLKIKK